MDPYQVLGINYTATRDEIKRAYRRLAMKWHPDRNQNSAEAQERFHQAAEAYKLLFERAPGGGKGSDESGFRNPDGDYQGYRDDAEASQDAFADSLFWDVMLDYAIKLAQTGLNEHEITLDICRNGCDEKLARIIADKAFNIHAHYVSRAGSGTRRQGKARPNHTTFKEERLDGELCRAFLGQRSYVWSPRDAIDYYLVVFREFAQSALQNPLNWISVNRRLMRLLNFAIVLFTVMLLVVHYYPGPSEYKLLADKDMLQIPFLILPLMFVWMLYRKLWSVTLVAFVLYLATIAYYHEAMPLALNQDLYAIIPVALVCFAPFVLIALYANFLYYLKARRLLAQAKNLFADHLDQLVWVKNRAGTTVSAPLLFTLLFAAALTHLIPQYWNYPGSPGFTEATLNAELNAAKLKKIRHKSKQALDYFELGEILYQASPPDYDKAEKAYRTAAANGSLLASYKLGYLHYTGDGVEQNDVLAFDYFLQATRAPLAFQPHSLELTTHFLAESYNNLGIMYQAGLGTRKNLGRAAEMYRRAVEFGSIAAKRNLARLQRPDSGRRDLALPRFDL